MRPFRNVYFIAALGLFAGVLIYLGFVFIKPDQLLAPGADSTEFTNTTTSGNIVVYQPRAQQQLSNPFVLIGEARVFENVFNYRLLDETQQVLAESFALAAAPNVGQFGPFDFPITYSASASANGLLEVFAQSAKDGSEIDKVSVPIQFAAPTATSSLVVFFLNTKIEPNVLDCSKVFAATRVVPKTEALARSALEQLFLGPSLVEQQAGYISSLNDGVLIQTLTIKDGLAAVDFNEKFNQNVGGSCPLAQFARNLKKHCVNFPA